MRFISFGIMLAALVIDPDVKFLARPRKVSTANDEYGIHQASGRTARRFV